MCSVQPLTELSARKRLPSCYFPLSSFSLFSLCIHEVKLHYTSEIIVLETKGPKENRLQKTNIYEQDYPHTFAIYSKNEATKLLIICCRFYLLINTKPVHGIHLRVIQIHIPHVKKINK